MYYLGLSFRDVSKLLRAMGFKVSIKQLGIGIIGMKTYLIERKRRRYVAIDETVIKCGRKRYYVWVAVDVERMEVIAAKISKSKGNLECLEIILDVEKCKNKPIFLVDGAPWYKEVLSRRGLKYEVRARGKRNAVESIFQTKEENEKLLQKISS